MNKKVVVALSGGIDSSVTAFLLKQQGYDVVGVCAKMTNTKESEQTVLNAKNVAVKLQIPFFELDATKEFSTNVINYFENTYRNGKTPNPCIMCNKYIKWGLLFDYAINELEADFIATGHYAKIKYENGNYKLFPASDEHKDQLYFLFNLDTKKLSKTLFPLSDMEKSEVRRIAEENDLPSKSAKESQDICFIQHPMTTKKYLHNVCKSQKGNFVEKSSGRILGVHDGFWQYTIGQRKGIGIAAPEPLYVIDIDAKMNVVYVGYKSELFAKNLVLKNVKLNYPISNSSFEAFVKIRYNMPLAEALINIKTEEVTIEFKEPVSSLTKGQACVIYNKKDGHLMGGAFI